MLGANGVVVVLGKGGAMLVKAAERKERPQQLRIMSGALARLRAASRELYELRGGSSMCLRWANGGENGS